MAKTKKQPVQYWLFKSEPDVFSVSDLARAPRHTTHWDGVRNYQARNLLRDTIAVGDKVLFYHSSVEPMVIAGTAEVVKAGYPDHTAFEPDDPHYDPKSDRDSPTWYMVDIKLLQEFARPVTRQQLSDGPETAGMMVLKRGSRLSIQPVTAAEWKAVHKLAGVKEK